LVGTRKNSPYPLKSTLSQSLARFVSSRRSFTSTVPRRAKLSHSPYAGKSPCDLENDEHFNFREDGEELTGDGQGGFKATFKGYLERLVIEAKTYFLKEAPVACKIIQSLAQPLDGQPT
jgi:hypothetical protein